MSVVRLRCPERGVYFYFPHGKCLVPLVPPGAGPEIAGPEIAEPDIVADSC
jgi:hypothetical protein